MSMLRKVALRCLILGALLIGGVLSAVPEARASAAVDRVITLGAPLAGTTLTSPAQVNGSGTITPFESRLVYTVLDENDEVIGVGPITVQGQPGQPYTFNASITFNATKHGPGRLIIDDVNESGNRPLATVSVEVSLRPSGVVGGVTCYSQTDQCLQGRFLEYWTENGDLDINGFPLTGEFRQKLEDGNVYVVQYFERVRLEYHPQNPAPFDVLLGQFGRRILAGVSGAPTARAAQDPAKTYFAETGHNVGPEFGAYWTANGGLPTFGYPLTELFEQRLEDGQTYQVQYFERARFELHPEASDERYRVQLGQFGRQILNQARGATPRAITIEAPAGGANVGPTFEVRGRTTVIPAGRSLTYRVTALAGGAKLAEGPVTVQGDFGSPGTFAFQVTLAASYSGGARIELLEFSEADGSILASGSVEVTVGPTPR